MYLDAARQRRLARVIGLLSDERSDDLESLHQIGRDLLDLLGADHYASYLWDPEGQVFHGRVALNVAENHIPDYERYFQFHDPITAKLQVRRRPTLVREIMARRDLMRTEFFNDFLRRDGLYYGINFYAYDGGRNIGDMRIWRRRGREDYEREDVELLALIAPAFTHAMRRRLARQSEAHSPRLPPSHLAPDPGFEAGFAPGLTRREAAVASLAARGLSDKEIARRLGIGFTTVRSHLESAFAKLGVRNRTGLAAALFGQ